MMGVTAMTTEEDDFADFQAAPPTSTPTIPHAISQPAIPQQTGKIFVLSMCNQWIYNKKASK